MYACMVMRNIRLQSCVTEVMICLSDIRCRLYLCPVRNKRSLVRVLDEGCHVQERCRNVSYVLYSRYMSQTT